MDPIPVPEPERSAFNKHRPPSDLLRSQLEYFQHLQHKHGHHAETELVQAVTTENGAARYIAHMTRLIRDKAIAAGKGTKPAAGTAGLKIASRRKATGKPERGLALAAADAQQPTPKGRSRASASARPTPARPAPRQPAPKKAAARKPRKNAGS